MIATDLKTSYQMLKIEVFKLNDRVRVLNMFSGQEKFEDERLSDLFELLMNDVLVSINRLTNLNPMPSADINIAGFYSNLADLASNEIISREYQDIIDLSRNLCRSNATELLHVGADERYRTIQQAEELAGHLKEFTEMLRPHIEYD